MTTHVVLVTQRCVKRKPQSSSRYLKYGGRYSLKDIGLLQGITVQRDDLARDRTFVEKINVPPITNQSPQNASYTPTMGAIFRRQVGCCMVIGLNSVALALFKCFWGACPDLPAKLHKVATASTILFLICSQLKFSFIKTGVSSSSASSK